MKTITVFNRNEFRKWLSENHENEHKVAVIVHKKHTGKPTPSHRELMEEAICFGWIDTTIQRMDEDRYIRHFCKRNKNSRWSENTLGYAKDLIAKKKMTPMGMKYYKEGLAKPTHDAGIPKNPDMPKELKDLLRQNKAMEKFDRISPSARKMIYRWILKAKRKETKARRIRAILSKTIVGDTNFLSIQNKA